MEQDELILQQILQGCVSTLHADLPLKVNRERVCRVEVIASAVLQREATGSQRQDTRSYTSLPVQYGLVVLKLCVQALFCLLQCASSELSLYLEDVDSATFASFAFRSIRLNFLEGGRPGGVLFLSRSPICL